MPAAAVPLSPAPDNRLAAARLETKQRLKALKAGTKALQARTKLLRQLRRELAAMVVAQ